MIRKLATGFFSKLLGWPMIVLGFHYGTSAGSVRKTEILTDKETE